MPSLNAVAVGLVSYAAISVLGGLIVGKFIKGRPPQISNSPQSSPHAVPDLTFAGGPLSMGRKR